MSSNKVVNLVYILGNGHSGTTLLNCLLSSSQQIFAGGHLRNLYKLYSEPETRLCGSGNVVQDCDWWSSVKSRMDNEGLGIPDKKGEYIPNTIYGFYKAILKNGHESIICDSSLDYSYLKYLEKIDGINVFVIHIVRDGRAVWYSHNKKNSNTASVPFSWLISNLYLRFKYRNANNYHLVRYEDIVSCPDQVVKNILFRVSEYFKTNIEID